MYQTRQGELGRGEQIINDIALTDDGNALFTAAGNMVRIWDVRRSLLFIFLKSFYLLNLIFTLVK